MKHRYNGTDHEIDDLLAAGVLLILCSVGL
jgi:hypothetical protein